jgi:hypothetical protein
MPIDYSSADEVLKLSFGSFNRTSVAITFPSRGILSSRIFDWLDPNIQAPQIVKPADGRCFASAAVEMWHRAIHSFLWSVAITESSPMWSAIIGYYSSHFVMRAFAHTIGFFKSFLRRRIAQITIGNGRFVCSSLPGGRRGEHAFYWEVVKDYPPFKNNPLFKANNERDASSDAAHRNFANYIDHIGAFLPVRFPIDQRIVTSVEKISVIRRFSVTSPSRDNYPDLFNVQILAYQRIVTFQDSIDDRIAPNRFWKQHRYPIWCKPYISFRLESQGLEEIGE